MERRGFQGVKRRASVVNGIFYPENQDTLKEELSSWGLKEGSSSSRSRTQAIIAPHGAWNLTGSIAATAFSAVQKKRGKKSAPVSRVLLLGTHHHFVEDGIYLSESASFETPLGDIQVDQKMNRELASCSTGIRINDIPHLSEHSIEVLLPMVKYCFPNAKIVPLLMKSGNKALISSLGGALKVVFERHLEESLIVISSSVSQAADPAIARNMAEEFRTHLEKMDTAGYKESLASGSISACGGALIGAVMESGIFKGRKFSSVCPFSHDHEENSETVYYGAFVLSD
ncbi:MAG: AmmeMemoRadiSam system protein B [Treponema sp.]|nr:AmmeMemoRadiSam system protein B [Treponema sp.]